MGRFQLFSCLEGACFQVLRLLLIQSPIESLPVSPCHSPFLPNSLALVPRAWRETVLK